MKCDWQAYLSLFPPEMRIEISRVPWQSLEEVRVRVGQCILIKTPSQYLSLKRKALKRDLEYMMNAATQYSPWTSETLKKGYLQTYGGHRIGVCGQAVIENGEMLGLKNITSLCLRLAKDCPGISAHAEDLDGSILILGPPGRGKTTFLRDLIRHKSMLGKGSVSVIDEKGEIFPFVDGMSFFDPGPNTDIMTGVGKKSGIMSVLKNMGPAFIAVDEITEKEDCRALEEAARCGVSLMATVHADRLHDLLSKKIYEPLWHTQLFSHFITLDPQRSWKEEFLHDN